MNAIIYYHPDGRIAAISFRPDPNIGNEYITVPLSVAEPLMTGAENIDDWKIGIPHSGASPTLMRATENGIIDLEWLDDGFVPLQLDGPPAFPHSILIRVVRNPPTIVMCFESPGLWDTENEDYTVTVVLAKRDDPSIVYAIASCPVKTLIRKRRVPISIKRAIPDDFMILTRRVLPTRAEIVDVDLEWVPYPGGRAPSLRKVPVIHELPEEPCLLIRREKDEMVFEHHLGGGPRYEVVSSKFPVIFSEKGKSADYILAANWLPYELVREAARIPAPDLDDFDIHMPLGFQSTYYLKTNHEHDGDNRV